MGGRVILCTCFIEIIPSGCWYKLRMNSNQDHRILLEFEELTSNWNDVTGVSSFQVEFIGRVLSEE